VPPLTVYCSDQAHSSIDKACIVLGIGQENVRRIASDEAFRMSVPALEAALVADRALELGALMVNDVTALRGDRALAETVARHGACVCLVHMQGVPGTMQVAPRYDDVVDEVASFLEQRLAHAVAEGIREDDVCLDPGIGFGKTLEHNLRLLARLDEIAGLGFPVVIGLSRKRFLGALTGREVASDRVAASVAANVPEPACSST